MITPGFKYRKGIKSIYPETKNLAPLSSNDAMRSERLLHIRTRRKKSRRDKLPKASGRLAISYQ